jgi:hypothetical protein
MYPSYTENPEFCKTFSNEINNSPDLLERMIFKDYNLLEPDLDQEDIDKIEEPQLIQNGNLSFGNLVDSSPQYNDENPTIQNTNIYNKKRKNSQIIVLFNYSKKLFSSRIFFHK